MRHLPHENYMTILIALETPRIELLDELRLLRLAMPQKELLDYLYRKVPRVSAKGRFRASPALKRWAEDHELRQDLLNPRSKRVKDARQLCFHSKLRELLNLGLLNPQWSWDEVKENTSRAGARGLSIRLIKDYQQLFWNFNHMSSADRSQFFLESGSSEGTRAAADGYPLMGYALDHGLMPDMTDSERLKYMMDLAVQKYARDMHSRRCTAADTSTMLNAVMNVQREMRRLEPVKLTQQVVYDGGVHPELPTIDHLGLLEEDIAALEEDLDTPPTLTRKQEKQLDDDNAPSQSKVIPFRTSGS